MSQGIKHLIECHCTLKIFKNGDEIIYHKFPVYSKLDEEDRLKVKMAKCNNCGVIHKIVDVCKSDIISGKDDSISVVTKEDLDLQIDPRITNVLRTNECDISVWEHVADIIEEERWNETIVLRRQVVDGEMNVKVLKVLSENRAKIENHVLYGEIMLDGELNENR